MTLAFLKVAFVFALLSTSILLCIPSQWIGWIFGLEFVESKLVIIALGFGIIILSCNIILSHYFSGFGKYKINTIASVIGLIITAGLGLSFIQTFTEMPYMKVIVSIAAITSFSYTVSFVFTFFCFLKDTQLKIKDFKIKKNDFQLLLNEIKKSLISGSRYLFYDTLEKNITFPSIPLSFRFTIDGIIMSSIGVYINFQQVE